MRAPDWIQLLETSYMLDEASDAWRHHLLEGAAPLFGRESGVVLFVAQAHPDRIDLESVDVLGPPGSREIAVAVNDAGPPGALDLMYRSGPVAGSLSERIFANVPGSWELFSRAAGPGIRDGIGVVGRAGASRMVVFVVGARETVTTSPRERTRWHRAMTHVCAGFRLRQSLSADDGADLRPDAMLDPGGRVADATGPAKTRSARETLRDAVKRMEGARTACGRRDPDEAMQRWRGLVAGRWSLVDRFESDGKRYIAAVENEPEAHDPRGLSRREFQVAERLGLGRSTKEIAYELGISLSAVSMAIGSARRKLGLGSRAELAAFFAPGGIRARLAETQIGGERMLVGSHPLLDESTLASLSPAEREIALALVAGSTTADVAERRGTAERTVANQIASIFDKLGIHSRIELAARLSGGAAQAATTE